MSVFILIGLALWLLPTALLALWISRQHDGVGELRREVARLRAEVRELRVPAAEFAAAAPVSSSAMSPSAVAAAAAEPVLPAPAPAADPPERLAPPPAPEREPERESLAAHIAEGLEEGAVLDGAPIGALVEGLADDVWAPTPPPSPVTAPRRPLDELLAEHGLVWAGGIGLALGGLLMAAYAAQQGFFSPRVRIGAAWAVGVIMLVAGEAIRRGRSPGASHPQAAALTTAAGAATLYGAVWAGHALYGFIGLGAAAALLAGVSAGLFALAFLHGQTLAWLAIGGAYAAPLVVDAGGWPRVALGGYLLGVLATGAGASALRRWGSALGGAAAGALIWALLGASDGDAISAVALALGAAVAVLAGAERWPRVDRLAAGLPQIVSSVLGAAGLALAWGAYRAEVGDGLVAPSAVALLALAAWAVRRGLASSLAFTVATAGAVSATALVQAGQGEAGLRPDLIMLTVGAAAAAAALASARRVERPRLVTATGVLALFALAVFAGVFRGGAAPVTAWADPLVAAGVLASLALLARRWNAQEQELDIWVSGAAAALIVGIAQASTTLWAPVGYGVAAAVLALVHLRLKWRSWAGATAAMGTTALGALLTPHFINAGVSEAPGPGGAALAAAVLLGLAAFVLRRGGASTAIREGVQTMGVVAVVVGVMLQVRWWGSERSGLPLEPLVEAGLYGLSLSVSGLIALIRQEPDSGVIARRRGPALIAAGSVVSAVAALVFSPWWGVADRASGLPVLNSLAVAYLAPGAVLLAAAIRMYVKDCRFEARLYGAGGSLFTAVWALLEVRRSFQGVGLGDPGRVSVFEASAYALAILAAPFVLRALVRRLPSVLSGLGEDVAMIAERGRIGAVLLSVALMAVVFNPWWGRPEPLRGAVEPFFALACYAAAAILCAAHGRSAPLGRLRTTALVATALHLFVLLTLAIRVAYHGAALRGTGEASGLETWTYSAVWALFGVALLAFSVWRREVSLRWCALIVLFGAAAKVLLLDLGELDGLARAGSFLAVGALFIAGALLARRLTARGGGLTTAPAEGA